MSAAFRTAVRARPTTWPVSYIASIDVSVFSSTMPITIPLDTY